MFESEAVLKSHLLHTLQGLQFAVDTCALHLPGEIGQAYRAGYANAIMSVALAHGLTKYIEPTQPRTTIVAPQSNRLGGI